MLKAILNRKVLLVIVIIITYSAQCYSQGFTKEINSNIVLEIPPVKITLYEYKKNLNEFINNFKNKNKALPNEKQINDWNIEFIDRTFLLAELYSIGFNKRSDVINTVNSMARLILTQDQGLVLNEVVDKNINITEEEIKEAYQKNKKQIKLEYLKFPDKTTMNLIFGIQHQNIQEKDFDSAIVLAQKNNKIVHNTLFFQWPYSFLGTLGNDIYNSNVGDIIYTYEDPDVEYIYCTKEINYIEQKPYKEIKEDLKEIIAIRKKDELRKNLYKKFFKNASLKVSDSICSKFMDSFNFDIFTITDTISKPKLIYEQFKPIYNAVIASYYINGKGTTLSVSALLDHYSNRIMMPQLNNCLDLEHFIAEYVKEEYLLIMADSLNLAREEKFILDKINYKNKTILGFYEYRELAKQINITDKEIYKEYEIHKEDFKTSEVANFTLYTFNSMNSAYSGMMELRKKIKTDSTSTKNLKDFLKVEDITIDWNTKTYPPETISKMFDLKIGEISNPIDYNDNFIVVLKHDEKGSFTKPLNAVKQSIKTNLEKLRRNDLKNKLTEKAKATHSIVVNKI